MFQGQISIKSAGRTEIFLLFFHPATGFNAEPDDKYPDNVARLLPSLSYYADSEKMCASVKAVWMKPAPRRYFILPILLPQLFIAAIHLPLWQAEPWRTLICCGGEVVKCGGVSPPRRLQPSHGGIRWHMETRLASTSLVQGKKWFAKDLQTHGAQNDIKKKSLVQIAYCQDLTICNAIYDQVCL